MHQWEYCYVLLMGHPKGEFHLCTVNGDEAYSIEPCRRAKDPRACVIAYLGMQGWEAFAEGQTHNLWFKRPKQQG
jgi:hypothetical protein